MFTFSKDQYRQTETSDLCVRIASILEVSQTFYTLDIVLCVARHVHSCVVLHFDLVLCAVLLHARGCP